MHDEEWDSAWSVPQREQPGLVLLARAGVVDPSSLASYEAHGGYDALRKAVEMGASTVVDEVVRSGLVGRGGAAFPTGRKWQAVAGHQSRPHYLVANADESEPGTFKDRVLIENDPFALVEAMTIAGFATGCEKGYLYVRGEYPIAWRRLAHAIDAARSSGLLGDDILGRGVTFDIELRKGAGAYICGEETALFNSIEGYRGEPRSKPPFPTDVGLFGQPTVENNVETLVNVLPIVLHGGEAFASSGSGMSTGTKLFCLSGHVARPGVYEVPFGPTLCDVLDLAGGVAGTGKLQAVLLGGVAGRFVGPEALDTPLTFEGARSIGASLGSGVILPLDDTVDLRPLLVRIAEFFRHESCGQCVPCRVGTVRQQEALVRLTNGADARRELALLDEVGQCMHEPVDLRARAGRVRRGRVRACSVSRHSERVMPDVDIDGQSVSVPDGATLLDACRTAGVDVPTLCYGETLHPKNACRICVVELEGSRVLAPACSRLAEDGMVVRTADRPHVARTQAGARADSRRRRSSIGRRTWLRGSTSTAPAGSLRRPTPRPCTSPRRSTTTCTCVTTAAASSATSASTPAVSNGRTRSPSRLPVVVSTPTSPLSGTPRSPIRHASTAATASRCARRARSRRRPSSTCATTARGTKTRRRSRRRSAATAASAATSSCTSRTTAS